VFCHPSAGVFAAGDDYVTITNKNKSTCIQTWWTVRRSRDGGATWATVEAFPGLIRGMPASSAVGIGADRAGNIYVVGQSNDAVINSTQAGDYWLVRKSTDGGTSWTTADSWKLGNRIPSAAQGIAGDASGNVFVVGTGGTYWIVRESRAGTGTWQTVDNFHYGSGATPNAIVADDSGNVVVAGYGYIQTHDVPIDTHWIVRKLIP